MTDTVGSLQRLDIGRSFILLVLVPVQFPEERELAGQVPDGLQIAVGQPEDAVGLHERHGGEDVIGDIAGAVDDHIGGDLTQTADEFLGLLLGAGRVGILVLALSQPQYGQIGQLFVGGQVVLDEVDGDALGRKDAARDLSHSSSEGGQMQGIMGAVMSQSSSATFFFWEARCFAIFTAVTVLPQPGFPTRRERHRRTPQQVPVPPAPCFDETGFL